MKFKITLNTKNISKYVLSKRARLNSKLEHIKMCSQNNIDILNKILI